MDRTTSAVRPAFFAAMVALIAAAATGCSASVDGAEEAMAEETGSTESALSGVTCGSYQKDPVTQLAISACAPSVLDKGKGTPLGMKNDAVTYEFEKALLQLGCSKETKLLSTYLAATCDTDKAQCPADDKSLDGTFHDASCNGADSVSLASLETYEWKYTTCPSSPKLTALVTKYRTIAPVHSRFAPELSCPNPEIAPPAPPKGTTAVVFDPYCAKCGGAW